MPTKNQTSSIGGQVTKVPRSQKQAGFTSRAVVAKATLGERLAQHRRELGLSQAEVAHRLKINSNYIAALESCQADQLPGTVYAIAFCKAYAFT